MEELANILQERYADIVQSELEAVIPGGIVFDFRQGAQRTLFTTKNS